MAYIADLRELRGADIACKQIGDSGIARLKALTRLEVLKLNHSQITDAGLAELMQLPKLRHLEISYTPITDNGILQLQALPQLELLEVGPYVTLETAKKLKASLPLCHIRGTRGQVVNAPHFTIYSDGTISVP